MYIYLPLGFERLTMLVLRLVFAPNREEPAYGVLMCLYLIMLSELRKLLRSDLKMIANGKLGGI
jgi:hypothetical protein